MALSTDVAVVRVEDLKAGAIHLAQASFSSVAKRLRSSAGFSSEIDSALTEVVATEMLLTALFAPGVSSEGLPGEKAQQIRGALDRVNRNSRSAIVDLVVHSFESAAAKVEALKESSMAAAQASKPLMVIRKLLADLNEPVSGQDWAIKRRLSSDEVRSLVSVFEMGECIEGDWCRMMQSIYEPCRQRLFSIEGIVREEIIFGRPVRAAERVLEYLQAAKLVRAGSSDNFEITEASLALWKLYKDHGLHRLACAPFRVDPIRFALLNLREGERYHSYFQTILTKHFAESLEAHISRTQIEQYCGNFNARLCVDALRMVGLFSKEGPNYRITELGIQVAKRLGICTPALVARPTDAIVTPAYPTSVAIEAELSCQCPELWQCRNQHGSAVEVLVKVLTEMAPDDPLVPTKYLDSATGKGGADPARYARAKLFEFGAIAPFIPGVVVLPFRVPGIRRAQLDGAGKTAPVQIKSPTQEAPPSMPRIDPLERRPDDLRRAIFGS